MGMIAHSTNEKACTLKGKVVCASLQLVIGTPDTWAPDTRPSSWPWSWPWPWEGKLAKAEWEIWMWTGDPARDLGSGTRSLARAT